MFCGPRRLRRVVVPNGDWVVFRSIAGTRAQDQLSNTGPDPYNLSRNVHCGERTWEASWLYRFHKAQSFKGSPRSLVVTDVVQRRRCRSRESWTASAVIPTKTSCISFQPWHRVRSAGGRSTNLRLSKRNPPERCCLCRPWSSVCSGGPTCKRFDRAGGAMHRLPENPSCLLTGESVRRLREGGGPTLSLVSSLLGRSPRPWAERGMELSTPSPNLGLLMYTIPPSDKLGTLTRSAP